MYGNPFTNMIPSAMAMNPALAALGYTMHRAPSAQEVYRNYIKEINELKNNQDIQDVEIKKQIQQIQKCELHPNKQSLNCRTCKKINEKIDEIKKKIRGEKVEKIDQKAKYRKLMQNLDSIFPIWGSEETCNLNQLLRNHIINSQYFKELYVLSGFHEVIEQICKKATHIEPWNPGAQGQPSVAFCALYKFMVTRLTVRQIRYLLDFKGSPYVRCIGFLYVRYVCDPEYLMEWLGRYLMDEEEVRPSVDPNFLQTIGEYVEKILTDMSYYQTRFPRIPSKTDREIQVRIQITQDRRERKELNLKEKKSYFQKGTYVFSLSRYDDYTKWHKAIIEKLEGKNIKVRFFNFLEDQEDLETNANLLNQQEMYEEELQQQQQQDENTNFQSYNQLQNQIQPDLFQNQNVIINQNYQIQSLSSLDYYGSQYQYQNYSNYQNQNLNYSNQLSNIGMDEDSNMNIQKVQWQNYNEEYVGFGDVELMDEDDVQELKQEFDNILKMISQQENTNADGEDGDGKKQKKKADQDSSRSQSLDKKSKKKSKRSKSRERNSKSRDRHRSRSRDRRKSKSRDRSRDRRSRSRDRRSRSRSKDRQKTRSKKLQSKDDIMRYVIRKKQNEATADSKAGVAKRPTSYKTSLSNPMPVGGGGSKHLRGHSRSPSPQKREIIVEMRSNKQQRQIDQPVAIKKTSSSDHYKKIQELMKVYGDSSMNLKKDGVQPKQQYNASNAQRKIQEDYA